VHGPLQATLLLDTLARELPSKGLQMDRFMYRATQPLICNSKAVPAGYWKYNPTNNSIANATLHMQLLHDARVRYMNASANVSPLSS
jgi:hydroxyacyl-ACP dehydratase HTD2-like protein with hotdog domain